MHQILLDSRLARGLASYGSVQQLKSLIACVECNAKQVLADDMFVVFETVAHNVLKCADVGAGEIETLACGEKGTEKSDAWLKSVVEFCERNKGIYRLVYELRICEEQGIYAFIWTISNSSSSC